MKKKILPIWAALFTLMFVQNLLPVQASDLLQNVSVSSEIIERVQSANIPLESVLNEDENVSQSVPNEENSGSQSAPSEDESTSQSVPNEENSDSQSTPSEDESTSQSVPNEENSGSQSAPSEDESTSQSVPNEESSASQDREANVKRANGLYVDSVNGNKLKYHENGQDVKNQWKTVENKKYYFGSDGYAVTGEQRIDNVTYQFHSDFTLRVGELYWDWHYNGGRLRYINPNTLELQKGWLQIGGVTYYFNDNGATVAGWEKIGGDYYYFHPNSFVMAVGTHYIDKVAYQFLADGRLQTGALYWDWQYDGGRLRYIVPGTNQPHKGWLGVGNGVYYYFDAQGLSVKGPTIIQGVTYQFRDNFTLQTGELYWDWQHDGGRLRYIRPGDYQPYKGWLGVGGGVYYYFDAQGLSVKGPTIIQGVTYQFRDNFTLQTGELYWDWQHDGGRLRYIRPGDYQPYKGWLGVGNGIYYYFDAQGLSVKGPAIIQGVTYQFRDNFTLQTGELYWDWQHDGGRLRYIRPGDYQPYKGWLGVGGGVYYYFDAQGLSVKGPTIIQGVTYQFRDNFTLQTGELYWDWQHDGGRLRYIRPGDYQPYKGWLKLGSIYHYFDQNGLSAKGWEKIGADYYYFHPQSFAMLTGTQYIDSVAYNFLPDGRLQTGVLYWDWQYDGGRLRYIQPGTHQPYKGWLSLNGARYYFDENGLAVRGTIVIDGVQYVFGSSFQLIQGANKVIDVSAHQGLIDWKAVANSGIQYAIIRSVTWDKSAKTVGGLDSMFDYNVREAKKNGIKVGSYIYTYAKTEAEVQKEVTTFLTAMKKLEKDGYRLDMPVFIDQEDPYLLQGLDNNQRTHLLRHGMVLLDQNGYYPGMYMSTDWSQNKVNAEQLYKEGYDMWIADHRTSVQNPVWSGRAAMWQYTSKGSVPGIKGYVDLNYLYKDYSGLIQGSNNSTSVVPYKILVKNVNAHGAVVEDTLDRIVAAVVNNEVGNGLGLTGLDRQKLYQAQAIAARSWILYNYQNGNTLPAVGLKYDGNFNLILSQIEPVKNKIVAYQGKAAMTVYTAANNGKTNSASDYWGGSPVPYLPAGIVSPYDRVMRPSLYPTLSHPRTAQQVSEELKLKFDIDTSAYPDPATWFTIQGRNAAGYITTLSIAGKTMTAGKLNTTFSPILSTDFTVEYDKAQDRFTFKSNGFGHGVGMSQYGAAGYIAKEGWSYERVLKHYYPNTQIITIR